MRFDEKVVVITGAAGAIGSAIARAFLEEGALVALLDVDGPGLRRVAGALHHEGWAESRILQSECDVCDPAQVDATFAAIDDRWSRIDVMVANAGIGIPDAFLEVEIHDWRRVLDINLTGVFLVCQAAARRMVRQGCGALVTMSSTNGLMGERDLAAYNASKAGVQLLTKTMAIELAPQGIRANALCPGFIHTGLAERSGLDPAFIRDYVHKIPLGRLGRAEEVAQAALFLASDAASFITGIGLVIDGGQLAEE